MTISMMTTEKYYAHELLIIATSLLEDTSEKLVHENMDLFKLVIPTIQRCKDKGFEGQNLEQNIEEMAQYYKFKALVIYHWKKLTARPEDREYFLKILREIPG